MKRYETLFRMKHELKALSAVIRQRKREGYQHMREQYEYRHLHIARCLIKGRTIEEIESKNREDNKRDEKYLEKLMEKWLPQHQAEQVAWEAALPAAATA